MKTKLCKRQNSACVPSACGGLLWGKEDFIAWGWKKVGAYKL